MALTQQAVLIDSRRIPDERLIELLGRSSLNEHRLTAVAAQNAALTSRTQAILERMVPTPITAPGSRPDAPMVLYEAEPIQTPAKQGLRK